MGDPWPLVVAQLPSCLYLIFLIWHFCLLASFIIHSHPIWPSLSGPNCKVRLKMHCAGTFGCKTRYSGPAFSRLSRDLPQQDQTNKCHFLYHGVEGKAERTRGQAARAPNGQTTVVWSSSVMLAPCQVGLPASTLRGEGRLACPGPGH